MNIICHVVPKVEGASSKLMLNLFRSESSHTLLYGFEEAMLILDISIKWIKSLFEYDPEQKIAKILVKHCPKATVKRWLARSDRIFQKKGCE